MNKIKAFKIVSNNLSNSTINETCKGVEGGRHRKEVMRVLQMQSELTVEAGFEIHGGAMMMIMMIVEIVVAAFDDVASPPPPPSCEEFLRYKKKKISRGFLTP